MTHSENNDTKEVTVSISDTDKTTDLTPAMPVDASLKENDKQTVSTDKAQTRQNYDHEKAKKSYETSQAAMLFLCNQYPQIFSLSKPKPLKLGIQKELFEDDQLSHSKIRRGLGTYVRRHGYLQSQKEGVERIDLKGQTAGYVSAEEAVYASERLASYIVRAKEKAKRDNTQFRLNKTHKNTEKMERKDTEANQTKSGLKPHKKFQTNQSPTNQSQAKPFKQAKPYKKAKQSVKSSSPSASNKPVMDKAKPDPRLTAMSTKERMAIKLNKLINKHK